MKKINIKRRALRTRRKLKKSNKNRLRLSVHRSAKNIYAQIIDDKNNKTMVSASSLEKNFTIDGKKSNLSTKVGEILAKRANEKKISKVFLDRGKYRYHGRIKSLVESLRKNGLNF